MHRLGGIRYRQSSRGWSDEQFKISGLRAVPNCVVRRSYIAPGVVLMPSFVNLGAYVTVEQWLIPGRRLGHALKWAKIVNIWGCRHSWRIGAYAADPVIIEDNCFIGARSEVAEGVIVETGSVLSMGVYIGASTKIINRETGEITMGRVPAYSVVVPGAMPGKPLPDGSQGHHSIVL